MWYCHEKHSTCRPYHIPYTISYTIPGTIYHTIPLAVCARARPKCTVHQSKAMTPEKKNRYALSFMHTLENNTSSLQRTSQKPVGTTLVELSPYRKHSYYCHCYCYYCITVAGPSKRHLRGGEGRGDPVRSAGQCQPRS